MKRGHETGEEHLGCILYSSVKSVLPPVHRTPFHNHPATLSRCRLCRSLPNGPHTSSPGLLHLGPSLLCTPPPQGWRGGSPWQESGIGKRAGRGMGS